MSASQTRNRNLQTKDGPKGENLVCKRTVKPGSRPASQFEAERLELLDLDGGAGLFELGLDRVGLFLVHALLDRLGSRVDEVLGLLEAETGDRTHDLDHLDLLLACAGEDDVERRLLLDSSLAATAAGGSDCNGSGGGGG